MRTSNETSANALQQGTAGRETEAPQETSLKAPKKKPKPPTSPAPPTKPIPFPLSSTCGDDPALPASDSQQFDTRRWIGVKMAGTDCADYQEPNWSVTPLFSTTNVPTATLPQGLEKYCLVEADASLYGPGLFPPQPENETAKLLDLIPDKPVFPMESQLSQIAFPSMRDTFLQAAGYLPKPDLAIPGTPSATVDVVVLDTTPADGGVNLRSPHGISLYGMIDELMCGTQMSCDRRTKTELALGRYYGTSGDKVFDPDSPYASYIDPNRGGNFGTQGELAVAIFTAMARYESDQVNPDLAADRIVLNMSLGWDPALFGGFPMASASTAAQLGILNNDSGGSGVGAAVRAVHAALTYANCAGAVSLASTGNRVPATCDGGPLYPAAFNSFPRLDGDECKLAMLDIGLDDADFPIHGTSAAPIVYGVGATNWSGQRAAFQRPDAVPELNAIGFKGAAYVDDDLSERSGILTGTSVSSAVAAASIATAWSYHAEIAGGDLVAAITSELSAISVAPGTGLPVTDYNLGSGVSSVPVPATLARQIDLCGAASAANTAFSTGPIPCPSTSITAPDFVDTIDTGIITNGLSLDLEDSDPLSAVSCTDNCGGGFIFMEALGPGWNNGPTVGGNFILPQPHSGLCPACNVNGSGSNGGGSSSSSAPTGTATIALDDAYYHLTPGRVTIVRSGPGQPDVYIDLGEVLDPSDMSAITSIESPALSDDPYPGYDSATIVVELRDPDTNFEFNGTDALITE